MSKNQNVSRRQQQQQQGCFVEAFNLWLEAMRLSSCKWQGGEAEVAFELLLQHVYGSEAKKKWNIKGRAADYAPLNPAPKLITSAISSRAKALVKLLELKRSCSSQSNAGNISRPVKLKHNSAAAATAVAAAAAMKYDATHVASIWKATGFSR